MKPIFQLSGNSRVISVNAFEVGTRLLVAGGIRDGGFMFMFGIEPDRAGEVVSVL